MQISDGYDLTAVGVTVPSIAQAWHITPAAFASAFVLSSDLWASRVPGSRLTSYAACGHLPHVEHADRVANDVMDFLRENGS